MLNDDEVTSKREEFVRSCFITILNTKLAVFYGLELLNDPKRLVHRLKFTRAQLLPIKDTCMAINYISNKYNKD